MSTVRSPSKSVEATRCTVCSVATSLVIVPPGLETTARNCAPFKRHAAPAATTSVAASHPVKLPLSVNVAQPPAAGSYISHETVGAGPPSAPTTKAAASPALTTGLDGCDVMIGAIAIGRTEIATCATLLSSSPSLIVKLNESTPTKPGVGKYVRYAPVPDSPPCAGGVTI